MALGAPTEVDLVTRLVCLHPDGGVRIVDAEDFWGAVSRGDDPMEHDHEILVSLFHYDRDWDTAEVHPLGDEPVLVVERALTLLLDVDGVEQSCHVEAGTWCVVPAGVWHRALVPRPSRALHLTPGRGTQHRPAPGAAPDDTEPAAALIADAAGATISITDGVATAAPGCSQWRIAPSGSVHHQACDVVLVDLDALRATVVPAGALPGIDERVGPRTLVLAYGSA